MPSTVQIRTSKRNPLSCFHDHLSYFRGTAPKVKWGNWFENRFINTWNQARVLLFSSVFIRKTPVSVVILLKAMLRCSFTFIKHEQILLVIHGLWFSHMWTESHIWGTLGESTDVWKSVWRWRQKTEREDRRQRGPYRGPADGMKEAMKKIQRARQHSCTILHKLKWFSLSPLGKFK